MCPLPTKIGLTVNRFFLFFILAKETKCQSVRKLATKLAKTGFVDPRLGAFIPKCEEDGSYSKIQCLESARLCWCVNENGEERKGTRTKGIPNCDKSKYKRGRR